MRGTQQREIEFVGENRFIPACAGNAIRRNPGGALAPVHPRVCGERFISGAEARQIAGSSPRVRGTQRQDLQPHPLPRFIPACAGNAIAPSNGIPLRPVHPRVCGERAPDRGAAPSFAGSSPRVRGTLRPPLRDRDRLRFIPACAGNAVTGARATESGPVHPRVCGERTRRSRRRGRSSGSSPRVRGTPFEVRADSGRRRFIPACAGNAGGRPFRLLSPTVHPRVCGERSRHCGRVDRRHGSSPRVRGTRPFRPGRLRRPRFIPACAGNASGRGGGTTARTVHPRVCGERSR